MIKSAVPQINKVIPEWIVEEHLDFMTLLREYYKWAESGGQWLNETKQLMDNYNYELVNNDKLFVYKDVFLRLFPIDSNPDLIRSLLKFSKVFYTTRGNLESYEFLFKLLWKEDISIEFPSDNILRSSDGEWVRDSIMTLNYDSDVSEEDILGQQITGKKSGATAFISDVDTSVTSTGLMFSTVKLNNIHGAFQTDENIIIDKGATSILLNVLPTYGRYTIHGSGKGYLSGAKVPLKDTADGDLFEVKIGDVDAEGRILNLVVKAGVGYTYKMPVLDFNSEDVKDATIPFEIANIEFHNSTVHDSSGYYRTRRSELSDRWVLRDGHYYQEYSYVINSSIEFDTLYRPVIDLLHPAGTVFWFKSNNDFTSIGDGTKILYHDTIKIVGDSGIDISDKNVSDLVVKEVSAIDTFTGKLNTTKTYSFDTEETNLDDRIYFSYEKVLTSVIDDIEG